MERSGIVSFGGHSLRHDAVFTSPDYDDLLKPGPRISPFARLVANMLWGMPWFRREAECVSLAFVPNPDLLEAVASITPQEEKEAWAFFQDEERVNILKRKIASFGGNLGRFETPDEQKERLHKLFRANQDVLTKELGHAARSFCWPWGRSSPLGMEAATASGFSVFFTTRPGPNPPGGATRIKRMNAKRDAQKNLSRLGIYSRPLLGALYAKIRI
jgi:hypothetical protein